MPYTDENKQKEYLKNRYNPKVNISILRGDDTYDRWTEAAQNKGITLAKYAILAIKEKLERDGYI